MSTTQVKGDPFHGKPSITGDPSTPPPPPSPIMEDWDGLTTPWDVSVPISDAAIPREPIDTPDPAASEGEKAREYKQPTEKEQKAAAERVREAEVKALDAKLELENEVNRQFTEMFVPPRATPTDFEATKGPDEKASKEAGEKGPVGLSMYGPHHTIYKDAEAFNAKESKRIHEEAGKDAPDDKDAVPLSDARQKEQREEHERRQEPQRQREPQPKSVSAPVQELDVPKKGAK